MGQTDGRTDWMNAGMKQINKEKNEGKGREINNIQRSSSVFF